jgi:bacteriorhodopsin
MKRVAIWIFYAVSVLAILYVALNIYAAFTRPHLTPGEPIHIFRSPDGPNYS